MVTVIAAALVETLTKHMFGKFLDGMDKVEIGGAPSWYMVELDDELCTFAHKKGGYDSIEIAKERAKFKMVKKIDGIVEIVIHDNMQDVRGVKEQTIVDRWRKDANLPVFVNKHLDFSRVSYEDEVDTTFVRSCIPRETITNYQKDRLFEIESLVLDQKSKNAMDELDSSFEE
eukprot:Anaeramoba_flamelloidesa569938_62.p2 GENE.a569938_62~~a569938_62.p2  ORF type:complete len:173 (-),score=6.24 a569938_62:741-1259(-)